MTHKKDGKGSPLKKLSPQVAAVKEKTRSNSEPSILPMAELRRKAGTSKGKREEGRSRNNTGPPEGDKVKGQKGGSPKKKDGTRVQASQEAERVSAEVKRKICEMESAIHEQEVIVDKCQGELTTLTCQLTGSVSEIEELELKMENLRKAFKVSCKISVSQGLLTIYNAYSHSRLQKLPIKRLSKSDVN